ncbi:hypothetical protein BPC006_II0215 [Burkholderia pseudomallei BPC006]|nr:hypothetical protein BPC006_II0215 [Burkholderia pseudomallei BPC006]EDO92912.1 hypothetical protein BURPSPAST_E0247 [Burkholderia pseudomallei Pasteur 52237]
MLRHGARAAGLQTGRCLKAGRAAAHRFAPPARHSRAPCARVERRRSRQAAAPLLVSPCARIFQTTGK